MTKEHMITLIHGDDTTASRNYFFGLKSKVQESISLDGSKITVTDLTQALEGQDLFGDAKEIFIEELLSKKKPPKELEALASLLTAHNSSSITIWESKELSAKQISLFKTATIKLFKIPATIFAFLDAFRPNNNKQLLELFHTTLEDKEAEFIFFMLQRQVRILLSLHSLSEQSESKVNSIKNNELDPGSKSGMMQVISEVSRIAPWQKGKLEKQAGLFAIDKLLGLHSKIFTIEYGLKTGNLTFPLADEIDLLLLSL